MIATWMLYMLAVSALASLMSLGLERLLEREGRATRWIWISALVAPLLIPLVPLLFGGRFPGIPPAEPEAALTHAFDIAVNGTMWIGRADTPVMLERVLFFGWMLSILTFLAVLVTSRIALGRARRSWVPTSVAGEPVLVSEDTGPAVIGCYRPTFILPEWVLSLPEPAQRMIVMHEREHVRAGDMWLLLLALGTLLVAPWNGFLWWQFRRLRLAVEVDCDARILSGPVSPRNYGALLLDVAGRPKPVAFPIAAFADTYRGLSRRIRLLARPQRRARHLSTSAVIATSVTVGMAVSLLPAPQLPGSTYLGHVAFGSGIDALSHESSVLIGANGQRLPLPGAPRLETVADAIRKHHPQLLQKDTAGGHVIWFVADAVESVLHTGVESGAQQEVVERVLARHPGNPSDLMFLLTHTTPEGDKLRILWLRREPGTSE